ncbi:MAG: hypothetical protein JWN45_2370 [Acidobacteriaceae bacterium]|nr:hypothetical protein [Acidobacteriaceae bacterium]
MFESFSIRARHVVFAARAKGGERGTDALGVGDLVIGILLEDQNRMGTVLSGVFGAEGGEDSVQMFEPHAAFFTAESASDLLVGIEGLLSHSSPIPPSEDMSVSTDLSRVFELTEKLRNDLHHSQVQPLHLLAAILEDNSNQFADLFGRAGITKDAVFAALKGKPQ